MTTTREPTEEQRAAADQVNRLRDDLNVAIGQAADVGIEVRGELVDATTHGQARHVFVNIVPLFQMRS